MLTKIKIHFALWRQLGIMGYFNHWKQSNVTNVILIQCQMLPSPPALLRTSGHETRACAPPAWSCSPQGLHFGKHASSNSISRLHQITQTDRVSVSSTIKVSYCQERRSASGCQIYNLLCRGSPANAYPMVFIRMRFVVCQFSITNWFSYASFRFFFVCGGLYSYPLYDIRCNNAFCATGADP